MESNKKDIKLINNKNIEKLLLFIMINIFYIFVGSYLDTIKLVSSYIFAIGFIPLLVISIIIGIFVLKKEYLKKDIIYLFIILIILFGIISTIFAIDIKTSIWGFKDRYEGLITIVYYFSLMFLCSLINDCNNKKKIIVFIMIIGVINCIYAIFQINGNPNDYRIDEISEDLSSIIIKAQTFATGFAVNPNFFGTLMLICLSYSMGLYADEKFSKTSIFYIILSAVFIYGLLISNSMSVIIGLFFVLLVGFIYCLKNKKIKKVGVLLIVLLSMLILTELQNKTTLINDFIKTGEETANIASGNSEETYGKNRIYIWKNTLKIVPQNILNGVGIDNFYYAFGDKPLHSPDSDGIYDKAHNEYLQILVTEGILCLISYLIMYGIIVVRGVKSSFKNNTIYLILPVIGYLVQAFFNISVIQVAPFFFIAMGLNLNTNDMLEKSDIM